MANLIMRFPGGLPKALTLSYDDGVEQDEKLIEIAEKYGLKGTFNINSGCFPPEDVAYAPGTIHRRMPLERLKEVYAKSSWEIAAHAYTHASLVGLPACLAGRPAGQPRRGGSAPGPEGTRGDLRDGGPGVRVSLRRV